ncbi:MAG: histidine phosphatase family protein [Acetobacteraceae bacterium]|nr:histidine phosphatase family protein [Acetobacteraceae bacterium]
MRVVLIRHLAPLIAPGVCYGRLDIPATALTAAGLEAIWREVGDVRTPLLVTSPARRCLALAVALGDALGAVPQHDDRLLELDFGDWEGRRWADLDRSALDLWAREPGAFVPPGGEPVAALVTRVASLVADLRALGSDAVLVSHGGPLRVLEPMLRGEAVDLLKPAPAFGKVIAIDVQPEKMAATVSAPHSASCSAAPSTSPV